MEHGISKAKYRDNPKFGTVHIVAADCSSILPSWLETQITGRVPVWYPPGAAAMWVRRCPSLHDAFTAYSLGDVLLLLEGQHDLCGASGVSPWANNRTHRDLRRDGNASGLWGQSPADDLACWLPTGVSIIGVDPDKVVIRHSGLVARAVDTTHIAGVILKYVPPAGAQFAKAPSHSSASRRCIPGLRIVSGRLMLKHCLMDCGRRREAANPGIWVGPDCVLNLHRSSVEGDAAVGLQLAHGGLAVMGDSRLATSGVALVAMDTTMAGPHIKPATLLVGRACKLQSHASLPRSGDTMTTVCGDGSSRSSENGVTGAPYTGCCCTLLLLDARPAATYDARTCDSSARKYGSRGASSSRSSGCDPGIVRLQHCRAGTDNAAIGAHKFPVASNTHDRPLGVRVGVFSAHDSFNVARVEIPYHPIQYAASYARAYGSHAVPFVTAVTSDIARTLQPISSQPSTGSSSWKYGISEDDCKDLVQDLRRCMLSDVCLLIEVMAQEWRYEGDRTGTMAGAGTAAGGTSAPRATATDVRREATEVKLDAAGQAVVSLKSSSGQKFDGQVAVAALPPQAGPGSCPAGPAQPVQQQTFSARASCMSGCLEPLFLKASASCDTHETHAGPAPDAVVSGPQPAAAIIADKTFHVTEEECGSKTAAAVIITAEPVWDGGAAPGQCAFDFGVTAGAGGGEDTFMSPPRIGLARAPAEDEPTSSPATAQQTGPLDAALTPALLTVATVRAGVVPGTRSRYVAGHPSPTFSPYGFRSRCGRADKRGQGQLQCSAVTAVTFSLPADATDVQVQTPTCKLTQPEQRQLSLTAPCINDDPTCSKPLEIAADVAEAASSEIQSEGMACGPVHHSPPAAEIPDKYSDNPTIVQQTPLPDDALADDLDAMAAGGASPGDDACENPIDTSCLWHPEVLASPPGLFAQSLAAWRGAQDIACADQHSIQMHGEYADDSSLKSAAQIAATQVMASSSGRKLEDFLATASGVPSSADDTQFAQQPAYTQTAMENTTSSESDEDGQRILAVYKAWQEEEDDSHMDAHLLAGLELDADEERLCEDEFEDIAFRELRASEDNTMLQSGGKGENPFWWMSLEQSTEDMGFIPAESGKASQQHIPVGTGSVLSSPRTYGRKALAPQYHQSHRPIDQPLQPSLDMLMAAQAASAALLQHQNSCPARLKVPSFSESFGGTRIPVQRRNIASGHPGWQGGGANVRFVMRRPHAMPGGFPPAQYHSIYPAKPYVTMMPFTEAQPRGTQPSEAAHLLHYYGTAGCSSHACPEGAVNVECDRRGQKRQHEMTEGGDGRSDDGASRAPFAGDFAHYETPSVPRDMEMRDAFKGADEGRLPFCKGEGSAGRPRRAQSKATASAVPSQTADQCSARQSPSLHADRGHGGNPHAMVEGNVSTAPVASTGIVSSRVTEGSRDMHQEVLATQVDSVVDEARSAPCKRARRGVSCAAKGAAPNVAALQRPVRTTRRTAAAAANVSTHGESATAASSAVGVLMPTTVWSSAPRPPLHPPSPAVTVSMETCKAAKKTGRKAVSADLQLPEGGSSAFRQQQQEPVRPSHWSTQAQQLQQQILAQHQRQQLQQHMMRQNLVYSLPPGAPVHGSFV